LHNFNTWFYARETVDVTMQILDCPLNFRNDTILTNVNIPIDLNVLKNDNVDTIIATISLGIGSIPPQNGTVTFDDSTKTCTYTPNLTFVGRDSFEYIGCFESNPAGFICDTALVIVNVNPSSEICNNNIDDDMDSLIDCDDPDCQATAPRVIFRRNRE